MSLPFSFNFDMQISNKAGIINAHKEFIISSILFL